jgi:hypothetical protein
MIFSPPSFALPAHLLAALVAVFVGQTDSTHTHTHNARRFG